MKSEALLCNYILYYVTMHWINAKPFQRVSHGVTSAAAMKAFINIVHTCKHMWYTSICIHGHLSYVLINPKWLIAIE